MEDIVKACLKELMHNQPNLQILDDRMQSDVMAIALNRLPAKYVATAPGEVFAKTQLRMQVETDVYRELTNAVDKVLHSDRPSDLIEKND
nr:late competence development ComFB family protein [Paenibacillus hamazuiensis]